MSGAPETKGAKLERIPGLEELSALLGGEAYGAWKAVGDFVERNYDMDIFWDIGRKAGVYEKKYRRRGKTLCALYAREGEFGFLVVLGKKERAAFEEKRVGFSPATREIYDGTREYHDGKWLMLNVTGDAMIPDMTELLKIKKKPETRPVGRNL